MPVQDPVSGNDSGDGPLLNADVDLGLVLVVASAAVERVVISRIVERTGYRTLSRALAEATPPPGHGLPALVILDGTAGDESDRLVERFTRLRRPTGGAQAPLVILLGNAGPPERQVRASGIVDMVVARPITPDRLQPIIRDMMERLRG